MHFIKAERMNTHLRVVQEVNSLPPLGVMSVDCSTLNFFLRLVSLPHAASIRDATNSY